VRDSPANHDKNTEAIKILEANFNAMAVIGDSGGEVRKNSIEPRGAAIDN
jgi:hypothetical protein